MLSKQVFFGLAEELQAYYSRPLSDFVLKIWYERLKALDDNQFQSAVEKIICTSQFMPTPDQILEIACGGIAFQAVQEWNAIATAKSRYHTRMNSSGSGSYQELYAQMQLSTTGEEVLEALGGLKDLSEQTPSEIAWRRKEFLKLYAELKPLEQQLAKSRAQRQGAIAAYSTTKFLPAGADTAVKEVSVTPDADENNMAKIRDLMGNLAGEKQPKQSRSFEELKAIADAQIVALRRQQAMAEEQINAVTQ